MSTILRKIGLGLLVALACAVPFASAADWYVVAPGPAGGDGKSWAQAFTNIQTAIDTAANGDVIYLAAQTFTPPASALGIGKLVWTNKALTILGGYAADGGSPGALTSTSTTIRNTVALSTPGSANSNRLLYVTGVTNGILARVKLLGGQIGTSNPQVGSSQNYYGAGLYMGSCSNVTLDTVIFDGNSIGGIQGLSARGAGMYATNSWGMISNCVFKNGWFNRWYALTVYGGGLYLQGGGWLLCDSVIRDNTTANLTSSESPGGGWGIGICMTQGVHTLRNCAITRNYARSWVAPQGEALYLAAGTATVENSTFYWHRFEGVRRATGTLTLKNSIVWECGDDIVGTVSLQNCDTQDGDQSGANGNLSTDPLFDRGLYLATNSPCVNAGSVAAITVGLDGRTTRADGQADADTVDLGYHFAAGVTDLYVSVSSGSDTNAGTNTVAPFRSITKALSVARDGAHIAVAPGNYTATTETFPLTVPSNSYGIQLLGTNAAQTVINAAGANKRVLGMSCNYPDARVEGVTLAGANWQQNGGQGGGLYAAHSRGAVSSSSVVGNRIRALGGSWGAEQGGGVYMAFSSFEISNCIIGGNTAGQSPYPESAYGGGICWISSDGMIDACVITNNTCIPDPGNGVYPTTRGFGGGVYLSSDGIGITVRNCLIARNTATNGYIAGVGSGLYGDSAIFVLNSSIVANWHQGVYGGATVRATNCIAWANGIDVTGTVTAAYSDIGTGTYTDGGNNKSIDPMFVNAPADFRLMRGSPCVDAGIAQAWMTGAVDLDGRSRRLGGMPDMGCYEALSSGTFFAIR